jgi:hypothetical protein
LWHYHSVREVGMVILEASRKRQRNPEGDHPFADHPHFSPEAVEVRRRTHDRLRGGH